MCLIVCSAVGGGALLVGRVGGLPVGGGGGLPVGGAVGNGKRSPYGLAGKVGGADAFRYLFPAY